MKYIVAWALGVPGVLIVGWFLFNHVQGHFMVNPARDLEYPFGFGIFDMSTVNVPPEKDIPAEHALDEDDVIDPADQVKPVDPRDKPKSTLDEPDDIGVDVI